MKEIAPHPQSRKKEFSRIPINVDKQTAEDVFAIQHFLFKNQHAMLLFMLRFLNDFPGFITNEYFSHIEGKGEYRFVLTIDSEEKDKVLELKRNLQLSWPNILRTIVLLFSGELTFSETHMVYIKRKFAYYAKTETLARWMLDSGVLQTRGGVCFFSFTGGIDK